MIGYYGSFGSFGAQAQTAESIRANIATLEQRAADAIARRDQQLIVFLYSSASSGVAAARQYAPELVGRYTAVKLRLAAAKQAVAWHARSDARPSSLAPSSSRQVARPSNEYDRAQTRRWVEQMEMMASTGTPEQARVEGHRLITAASYHRMRALQAGDMDLVGRLDAVTQQVRRLQQQPPPSTPSADEAVSTSAPLVPGLTNAQLALGAAIAIGGVYLLGKTR